MTILLAEDKASLRVMLEETLTRAGYGVESCSTGNEAIRKLKREARYNLVLTDLKLPGADGMEVLSAAREADSALPVIVMTAYGTIEVAVEAMRRGAYDFIAKPIDTLHLLLLVERATNLRLLQMENILLREEYEKRSGFPRIVGESSLIKAVSAQIKKVAATDANVLLMGESGTGKELFARAVHFLSPRQSKPFVAINCAAIPETLMENELFGHEKGAYTGAGARAIGKFELASGGTVLLDEIGELSLSVQSKILRVLQERQFERVGGVTTISVDVRIVAASNKDLDLAVKDGSFREDLFYRLNVFPIVIPPLRMRKTDIGSLASHFLRTFGREMGKGEVEIDPEALEMLMHYDWPGNIRELENTIERAVILCDDNRVRTRDLNVRARPEGHDGRIRDLFDLSGSLQEVAQRASRQVERVKILETLTHCGNNKAETADLLQVSYRTLLAKIKDYALE